MCIIYSEYKPDQIMVLGYPQTNSFSQQKREVKKKPLLDLGCCFKNNNLFFYSLFSQKLSVSVSYNMLSYMQNATV